MNSVKRFLVSGFCSLSPEPCCCLRDASACLWGDCRATLPTRENMSRLLPSRHVHSDQRRVIRHLLPVLSFSPLEDLRWQVPAQFAAQGALDGDGLERELPDAEWHVAVAPFARDDELSPLDGWESECHRHSIGEDETKIVHRPVIRSPSIQISSAVEAEPALTHRSTTSF